jgi:hypothetical protein
MTLLLLSLKAVLPVVASTSKPWFVDKTIQQAQYMNVVNSAVLPGQVKDFLRYIASKATWNKPKDKDGSYGPCWASHDMMQIQMGRSSDYVSKAKQQAKELGWIQIDDSSGPSHHIYPVIGRNDPSITPKVKRPNWVNKDIKPVID